MNLNKPEYIMCFDEDDVSWWFQKSGLIAHIIRTNQIHASYYIISKDMKLLTKVLNKPKKVYTGRRTCF